MNKTNTTILRIGTYPTLQRPGMGLHAYKISSFDNFHVYYLTPSVNEDRFPIQKNCTLIEYPFYQKSRPRNSNILNKLLFQIKRSFSILSFSIYAYYLMLKHKINIVHIHSPMYLLIALLAKLHGRKVFVTYHGTDFHRIRNSVVYKALSPIFLKAFAISSDMLDDLKKIHGSNKVELVRNGIDTETYKNLNKVRKKQLVAVGSLKEEKGFSILLKSFAKLLKNKEFDNYELIIAGEGLLRKNLEKDIAEFNLQQKVNLVGHLNLADLTDLYNESEIFILSSISEGFPKVLLEAMSCGCKVVATRVGAIGDVLGSDEKFISNVNDVDDLTRAIKYSITSGKNPDPSLLKKYNWEGVQKLYQQQYEQD